MIVRHGYARTDALKHRKMMPKKRLGFMERGEIANMNILSRSLGSPEEVFIKEYFTINIVILLKNHLVVYVEL